MLLYNTDIILKTQHRVILFSSAEKAVEAYASLPESGFVNEALARGQRLVQLNRYDHMECIAIPDPDKSGNTLIESLRVAGADMHDLAARNKWEELILENRSGNPAWTEAFAEGIALASYQFLKYLSKPDEKRHSLQRLGVLNADPALIRTLTATVDAVILCRDLVNEPVSWLNAPRLGTEAVRIGREVGLEVEVLDKTQIETLKMGGLLAVNKGSIDPPRFIILTWEPEKPVNPDPLVLVGKGVMFDTGGLSLKPTPASMDEMKSDMAGAAAVLSTLYAVARLGLPVKVIGLIPATDNRPDGNAYVPGDIITMHDGSTVEVLNCDAEGRLILADALTYASRYHPSLVIDLATLTGSTQMALGSQASALMATASDEVVDQLVEAGFEVHERLVRLPLWSEFGKMLESEIADCKNIGGRYAGGITAGKFLERFAKYPWIHLDIAGTAFLTAKESYRGIGGTGTGVRLLLNFIKKHFQL